MKGEVSCQRWNKYHCRLVDERRHRRASLPCQVSWVLTAEKQPVKRQRCANSHPHRASVRELPLEYYSIGTKYKSMRPCRPTCLSKHVPYPATLSFTAFKNETIIYHMKL